ncbi:MAG: MBL fold metallo-hydrolase [Deltaproteobacteria bacterium]|nr:MBL fold metallo-hydrolase [Deltaproteobacteria bacterium]
MIFLLTNPGKLLCHIAMAEEILENLFRISIPLLGSPLGNLNSYLIKGEEKFLLIDTGWNEKSCLNHVVSELKKLNVDLKRMDIFITHVHADHAGLASALASQTSKVYFNREEAPIVNSTPSRRKKRQKTIYNIYLSNGFPDKELKKSFKNHPAIKYGLWDQMDFFIVEEGHSIDIGSYSFTCIKTPGHSPGHTCLYEPNKKILISGDHILFDITPNITFWPELPDSLKKYLESLEKVYALDVKLVLPGHRNLMNDHRKRITELKAHHEERMKEIISALKTGEKTVFEIAPFVRWDIGYKSWQEFPLTQKWFAFGETLAHLKYLEEMGVVKEEQKLGQILFFLT